MVRIKDNTTDIFLIRIPNRSLLYYIELNLPAWSGQPLVYTLRAAIYTGKFSKLYLIRAYLFSSMNCCNFSPQSETQVIFFVVHSWGLPLSLDCTVHLKIIWVYTIRNTAQRLVGYIFLRVLFNGKILEKHKPNRICKIFHDALSERRRPVMKRDNIGTDRRHE